MRGTLSHRLESDGRLRTARFAALCVAAGAIAFATTGCQEEGPPPSFDGLTQVESANTEGNDDFAWPADPSHPVLELRVAAPGLEGKILIELMPELAPKTIVNVIDLARDGYYDGTTFHRVIPGFMIQGGDPKSRDRDPSNDGTGGGETPLPDEFTAAPYLRGVVGMGNRGRSDSTSARSSSSCTPTTAISTAATTRSAASSTAWTSSTRSPASPSTTSAAGARETARSKTCGSLSVRPVGQVAAIRSAMELERQASGQLALAETQTGSTGNAAPTAADTPTGNPATPAALALEAFRP